MDYIGQYAAYLKDSENQKFKQIENLVVQIAHGPDLINAANITTVESGGQQYYSYPAKDNHVFISVTGSITNENFADPGEFEIEAFIWVDEPEEEIIIEEKEDDGSIKQKTIINGTVTEVVIIW